MCDIVYVLLVEQLERQVHSERQIAATLAAGGATDIEMPLMGDARAAFDAALVAAPAPESPRVAMLRKLGIV